MTGRRTVASRSRPSAGVRGDQKGRAQCGFTLLELLIVLSFIVILSAVGFPALQQMFTRSKLTGSAREISSHLLNARVQALRRGRSVVVRPSYATKSLVAFVDENDDQVQDPTELQIYNLDIPGTGEGNIYLMGENGIEGADNSPAESVDGFTAVGANFVAVFDPDGTIRDFGAFRISDGGTPPNVFEVRVEPRATARLRTLKYVYDGPEGDDFYTEGQGVNVWEWY